MDSLLNHYWQSLLTSIQGGGWVTEYILAENPPIIIVVVVVPKKIVCNYYAV